MEKGFLVYDKEHFTNSLTKRICKLTFNLVSRKNLNTTSLTNAKVRRTEWLRKLKLLEERFKKRENYLVVLKS